VDGVQVATSAGAVDGSATWVYYIGAAENGSSTFNSQYTSEMDVCRVALYSSVLSAARIAAHFKAFQKGKP
jgi:hypothetical protein